MLNTAIIVAAGIGQRFGGELPKQFIPLLGKPLIIHTVEPFEACSAIDDIIIVVADDQLVAIRELLTQYEFSKIRSVTSGGDTRSSSVRKGLREVDRETAWIVAVHDGARPLVTVDEITRTVEAASLHGAACLVADVTDTIKQVELGFITDTVPRAGLRRALTPQAFQYDILASAIDSDRGDVEATDECFLVERAGIRIFCVEGSSRNIKITRPDDLKAAEFYLCSE